MKSYTDIEQSKKLAEILPIESADMHWQYIEEDDGQLQWFCLPKDFSINKHDTVSAWSLAALFKMLPYSARLERGSSTELYYVTLPNELESSDWYIEPVDAVFEMILKLYKLKML